MKIRRNLVHFYNAIKGATDSFDQVCHSYTVNRKTSRWPMCVWFGIMDHSAMVLYNLKEGNQIKKRRGFLQKILFNDQAVFTVNT